MSMRRIVLALVAIVAFAITGKAQSNSDRLSLGVGCLYQNGLDLTLSYEHEGKYHHAWEFFANGYIKWAECASCKHICPESFWKNYRSYGFGVAYKPCVVRGRNYVLRGGWQLFCQVKTDLMIKGEDLFRTGIVLGVKLPLN